jgi:hypothetical protein
MAVSPIPLLLKPCIVLCAIMCPNNVVLTIPPKKKGLIAYNQHHETISMKKHILSEHPTSLGRWTNVNLTFAMKDQCQKSPSKGLLLDVGNSL